jgi:hypothetical protein
MGDKRSDRHIPKITPTALPKKSSRDALRPGAYRWWNLTATA